MQAIAAGPAVLPELHGPESSIEIEVRLRLKGGPPAPLTIDGLGLGLGEPANQDDQAYAPLGWNYGDCRIGITFARLRTVGDEHWFTVKRPITDVRTCTEHESRVLDRDAMHNAVLLMGFRPTVRIVKTRRTGRLGDVKVCLDDVHGLGHFLELEALARPGDDVTHVRRRLDAIIEELDLRAERCVDTYDTLIHHLPPQLSLV